MLGQALWDVWWGVGPIFLELLLCWDDTFGIIPPTPAGSGAGRDQQHKLLVFAAELAAFHTPRKGNLNVFLAEFPHPCEPQV